MGDMTPGYMCPCDAGYESNNDAADPLNVSGANQATCSDIDECNAGTDECGLFTSCVNDDGGYHCVCDPGHEGANNASDPLNNGTFKSCVDANECINNTHECINNNTCQDQQPGYECVCNAGYESDNDQADPLNNGDNASCSDIDECAGTNECGANTDCTNSDGGYSCDCQGSSVGNSDGSDPLNASGHATCT